MAFTLPDLPYAHDALASLGMSKETLEYHHDLHHKAYVDNGNKLIAGTEWESKSVEDIIRGTYQAGAVAQNGIFNNASQHWNHNMFWTWMAPGEGKKMPGALEKALTDSFGSVRERREPLVLRPDCASGLRRVGAQLLHRLPEQAPGLPDQLPGKAGKLGSRRRCPVSV
jgi:superoxide dismutase